MWYNRLGLYSTKLVCELISRKVVKCALCGVALNKAEISGRRMNDDGNNPLFFDQNKAVLFAGTPFLFSDCNGLSGFAPIKTVHILLFFSGTAGNASLS